MTLREMEWSMAYDTSFNKITLSDILGTNEVSVLAAIYNLYFEFDCSNIFKIIFACSLYEFLLNVDKNIIFKVFHKSWL